MDFDESPDEAAFRDRVRGWLEASCKRLDSGLPKLFFSQGSSDDVEQAKSLQAKLVEAGLAGLGWPKEYGGQGAPLSHDLIFAEEKAGYDLSLDIFGIGLTLAGPTIMTHGNETQKARYLPPLLEGREIWCQLFSEPDAGSDLASLRTRAVHDGQEWIVDGQKVWSSGAHYSDFGILPARTDQHVAKHKGLTYFIVDMSAPGVTVRPLCQMTGDAHFNEVFLDGVRLSDDCVLGAVGEGWQVTQTTLMNERMSVSSFEIDVTSLIDLARNRMFNGKTRSDDRLVRDALADVYIRASIVRFISYRLWSALAAGRIPGPEGSIAKLAISQLVKRASELSLTIEGAAAALLEGEDETLRAWQALFLVSPAMRILGGTDEIQRNIIAERVLGLPREQDPYRQLPFDQQPTTPDQRR